MWAGTSKCIHARTYTQPNISKFSLLLSQRMVSSQQRQQPQPVLTEMKFTRHGGLFFFLSFFLLIESWSGRDNYGMTTTAAAAATAAIIYNTCASAKCLLYCHQHIEVDCMEWERFWHQANTNENCRRNGMNNWQLESCINSDQMSHSIVTQ